MKIKENRAKLSEKKKAISGFYYSASLYAFKISSSNIARTSALIE
jgi:hypothetical protein